MVGVTLVFSSCEPEACAVFVSTSSLEACAGGSTSLTITSAQSGSFSFAVDGQEQATGSIKADVGQADNGAVTARLLAPDVLGSYPVVATVVGKKTCTANATMKVVTCPTLTFETRRTLSVDAGTLSAPSSSVSLRKAAAALNLNGACITPRGTSTSSAFYGVEVLFGLGAPLSASVQHDLQLMVSGLDPAADLFPKQTTFVTERAIGPQSGTPPTATMSSPPQFPFMAFSTAASGIPTVTVQSMSSDLKYFVEGEAPDGGYFRCEGLVPATSFALLGGAGGPFSSLASRPELLPVLRAPESTYRVGLSQHLAWPPASSRLELVASQSVALSGAYVSSMVLEDGGVR